MKYEFPSVNRDGVYCVSSSGYCRNSGHVGDQPVFGYSQCANPGCDPRPIYITTSRQYDLGMVVGFLFVPFLILLGYKLATKGKSY